MRVEKTFVSVVIPALNEEAFIGECLKALLGVDYPKDLLEIIVVDNGSRDATVAIARSHGVAVVEAPGATISALRNLGAARAAGELLAFVDADCVVDPGWLRAAVPCFADPAIGIAGSRYRHPDNPHWIEEAWYAQVRDMNRVGEVKWLSGGNMVVSRRCFKAVNGFDETLRTSEDVDFCSRAKRAGFRIFSDPRIRVVHLGNPKSLGRFFRRELWYSQDVLRKFIINFPARTNAKAVALGLVFAAGIVAAPVLALLAASGYEVRAAFLSVMAAMMAIPVAMSARALSASRKYALLPRLSVLYFMYGIARGVACLNVGNWRRPNERGAG